MAVKVDNMTELIRVKEEDFQNLLDYKKSIKGSIGTGCLTIKHDYSTDEYVLVHSEKSWAASIMENSLQMVPLMKDLEDYLEEGERA